VYENTFWSRRCFLTAGLGGLFPALVWPGSAFGSEGPSNKHPPAAPVPVGAADPGVHPRSAWRALAPGPEGTSQIPVGLVIHHTAGPCVGSVDAPAQLRSIQAYHQRRKGWIDIAYHLLVDADGEIWAGRDPMVAGDSATTYDTRGWILICALGHFDRVPLSESQHAGLVRAVRFATTTWALDPLRRKAHGELAGTRCPGVGIRAQMEHFRGV